MSIEKTLGSGGAIVTGYSYTSDNKQRVSVFVEGLCTDLDEVFPNPGDEDCEFFAGIGAFVVESVQQTDNGDGTGKLTVNGVAYGSTAATTLPERTTWKISMVEVSTELKRHEDFVDCVSTIDAWLATDPSKRKDDENFYIVDEIGVKTQITDATVIKFCKAYEKGVDTFLRHFPVIEKISYYKTLPGCSISGNSILSGTAKFSGGTIDKWDTPAVHLEGFADAGWFKSGDDYQQREDLSWVRTEQWTWSPSYDDQDLSWIYSSSSQAAQS